MKLECPFCGFSEITKVSENEYKCKYCNSLFTIDKIVKETYNWQNILNEFNNKYGLKVPLNDPKNMVQKFKLNTYSKSDEKEKIEYYTVDFENGESKPATPVVKQTNGICKEIVLHLLNEVQPPEFSTAAYKIKECVDKELKEVYKIETNSIQPYEMFNQASKDSLLSHECAYIWDNLEKFIKVNPVIYKIFPSDQAKKNFFLNSIELFENNNFLKKK